MALKGFITPETYTRIERIDFSKQLRNCSANITVYADETMNLRVLSTSVQVNGFDSAVPFTKIITDEAFLLDETNITSEKCLVQITGSKNEYINSINDSIVYRGAYNTVQRDEPNYLYDVNKKQYLKRKQDYTWEPTVECNTKEQFDELFASAMAGTSTITEAMYKYMLSLPIYVNCKNC